MKMQKTHTERRGKCKRYREEVLRFTDNLEEELYDLVADLEAGTYDKGKPGAL